MHIIWIILDGFKTYQVQTELSNFDWSFNCVTGKNGSGKSNILDAITFVLGNNKWWEMWVANMKGIICANGNLKWASVTIVFDNKQKNTSPTNYKDFDTIEVTWEVTTEKS